jgi:hypothetical protein
MGLGVLKFIDDDPSIVLKQFIEMLMNLTLEDT